MELDSSPMKQVHGLLFGVGDNAKVSLILRIVPIFSLSPHLQIGTCEFLDSKSRHVTSPPELLTVSGDSRKVSGLRRWDNVSISWQFPFAIKMGH